MERTLSSNFRPYVRGLFLLFLAAYLFLQNLYSDLERLLFWGEGFSLLLLLFCWKVTYSHGIQRKIIFGIYIWLILISGYAVGSTYFIWKDTFVPYYFLRHLAYFYYTTFFFAGYRWGMEMIQKLSRYWLLLLFMLILMLLGFAGSIGGTMLLGFMWLACQKGNEKKWLYYFIPVAIAYMYSGTGNGTAKAISLLLVCSPFVVYFLRLWVVNFSSQWSLFFFRIFVLLGAVGLVFGVNHLMGMVYKVVAAGGTFHVFLDDFAFTDMNGVWRILLWAYLFSRFLDHPLGIGLGTPLVGPELGSDFMYLVAKPGDEYTSGAHNSFITFLVRIGIPFLIVFVYLSFYCGKAVLRFLQRVHFRVLDTAEKRLVFSSILVFFMGVVQSSFNVILESPLAAGIFWFNFGLFVRIVGDFLATEEAPGCEGH